MCLVKYMMEEFEWHDEDIDSNGLEMPREAATETGTPIMTGKPEFSVAGRQLEYCIGF